MISFFNLSIFLKPLRTDWVRAKCKSYPLSHHEPCIWNIQLLMYLKGTGSTLSKAYFNALKRWHNQYTAAGSIKSDDVWCDGAIINFNMSIRFITWTHNIGILSAIYNCILKASDEYQAFITFVIKNFISYRNLVCLGPLRTRIGHLCFKLILLTLFLLSLPKTSILVYNIIFLS